MKQPNDTKTLDMLPNGFPAFELDHEHPWTLPPAKPYTPAPRTGWPPGMLQDDCRELSKWFASRLNAVRRLGA